MTVAVTGASGNVGTALLRRLTAPGAGSPRSAAWPGGGRRTSRPYDRRPVAPGRPGRARQRGGARRVPGRRRRRRPPGLGPAAGPPARDDLHQVNVDGTRRVARAAAAAGVSQFVHMSSIGAYAAGRRRAAGHRGLADHRHPERAVQPGQVRGRAGRPRGRGRGIRTPRCTVVRPDAGAPAGGGQRDRPLLPGAAAVRRRPAAARRRWPGCCRCPCRRWRVSFVHADDVADALARMLDRRAPGPFNLAAEPLLDADALARSARHGRASRCRRLAVRTALRAAFAAHVVPTEPGWLDIGTSVPGAGHRPRAQAAGLGAGPPQRRGAAPVRRGARPGRGRARPAAAPGGRAHPRPRRRPGERTRPPGDLTAHQPGVLPSSVRVMAFRVSSSSSSAAARSDADTASSSSSAVRVAGEQGRPPEQLLEERRRDALGPGDDVVQARGVDLQRPAVELEQRTPGRRVGQLEGDRLVDPPRAARPAPARAGRPGWWSARRRRRRPRPARPSR